MKKAATLTAIFLLLYNLSKAQITGIKVTVDTCSSQTISLQEVGTTNLYRFFWNFGDPSSGVNDTLTIFESSPFPFAVHTFSSPGIYTVCLTFQEPSLIVSTICRTVSVGICCNGIIVSQDSCLQHAVSFSISSPDTINAIKWDFGDPASGANNISNALLPNHVFSEAGNYSVRAIVQLSCGIDTIGKDISVISCAVINPPGCKFYVPNAFTPNNDNVNDFFYPLNNTTCTAADYELLIFNRWGQQVYHTTNPNNKWDGKYKNADCPIGNYHYILKYQFDAQTKQVVKGVVQLLR